MTISEVGKKYGLSQDTLRYYERIGLIPGIRRNKSGIRDYTENDCEWIEFIKCMRNAGVEIEALIEYVDLFMQGDATRDGRKKILIDQRAKMAARISEMQNTLERLDFKIEGYERNLLVVERELKKVLEK